MFNYVIITNKVTPEITKSLEILMKTRLIHDNIIVVNYNNYNIKYRSLEGIDYRHVKQSRKQAINQSLPRDANVVLIGSEFTISKNFVKDLYKHIDYKSLTALRVDDVSPDGKYTDRDFRVGSAITVKSFTHIAMVFNTALISKVGETAEETATIAQQWDVPLVLNPNIRVLKTNKKKRPTKTVGITILIPSLHYENIGIIREMVKANDKIYEFESDPRGLTRFINQKIIESHNECILIINPNSKIRNLDMLNKIRGLFDKNKCILFDSHDELTDNAWLVIPKGQFSYSHKEYNSVLHLHQHVLSYNPKIVKYIERLEKKTDRISEGVVSGDMISIIIPYMHNGDRWPLFDATIQRLYQYTKEHDNIEIVIHETSPKRKISPQYIEKYELVHTFTKYTGLFHRAWSLNVVAKHIAKGNIFVFFDADIIIDEKWVDELLTCDKTTPWIGWGEMKNLNQIGTNTYLKSKRIVEELERTRVPWKLSASGGINILPRDMFFNIGGWPEDYKDRGYGGEDNSMAYKMITLGMYGDNDEGNVFKSTVYHLFHGHATKRDARTQPIFDVHAKYDRDDWLEHIRRNNSWGVPGNSIDLTNYKDYINESLLFVYKASPEPRITICMVNYLRYDILLKSLQNYIDLGVPINLILWVNGSDAMDSETREMVEDLCSKLHSYDIIYSKSNKGTGYPRFMMLNKAYYEYETDYVMTTDDDIIFNSADELILGATVLDQEKHKSCGAMGLWCDPLYLTLVERNNNMKQIKVEKEGFYNVSVLGAATMTIRREVLSKCSCDPGYIIGLVDWDFSMAIRKEGYKLGLVCDDRFKPFNDTSSNSKVYQDGRSNNKTREASHKRFSDKWNINIKK